MSGSMRETVWWLNNQDAATSVWFSKTLYFQIEQIVILSFHMSKIKGIKPIK